tara:strand:+ start:240 stop:431 length:192 start_codon:yes stop_codon:yes gene_type:complete
MPAPNSKAENRELIEEVLKQIHSLKTAITEIRVEIAKINQIENRLKNGEVLASGNDGWFWFSS